MERKQPIGIFDSGYGGLSIMKEIVSLLPDYDYVYLGDNARVPYGSRSFETVFQFTWQCVKHLLESGCPLVIVACNTASAKALRTIQQKMLPMYFPDRKVLGVIRPTTEIVGQYTDTNEVGVFATQGTVASDSYPLEIKKFYPNIKVYQQACPLWVPLVEHNEYLDLGADFFVEKYVNELLDKSSDIDTIILGCTHYPLLIDKIRQYLPDHITLISQGQIVAKSLEDYFSRHDILRSFITRSGSRYYYTTDDSVSFGIKGETFIGHPILATHIELL